MATATKTTARARAVSVDTLPLSKIIVEDGFNPRTLIEEVALNELADSIRERGLLDALGVSPLGGGKFQLISGHRRHAACLRAGLKEAPVTIRDADQTERLLDAIASNQHREDLTPLDEALAFARLRAQGLTNKGIAEKLKVTDKLVADRLVIADLPAPLRERFHHDYPSSVARTFKTMCALAGGEALALAVQHVIDTKADGNPGGLLRDLRDHAVDTVDRMSDHHLPGVTSVRAYGSAGGGYKGGPREHSSKYNALRPDAIRPALSKEVADKLNVLVQRGGKDHYSGYAIYLDQACLDALRAANVLFTDSTDKASGVCIDQAALAAVVEPIIEADHKGLLKASAAQQRTADKGPEAQAKADEKAKAQAAVVQAREFNLQLGEQLATHFSEVEFTLETARMVCKMALLAAADDVGGSMSPESGVGALCKRGLRYIVPGWHQEVLVKSTGVINHRYPGEGTKNKTGDKTRADDKPADLFWEWWNLAQTPAQVLGRTIQAIAAARYAKEEAVPQSRRVGGSPWTPYNGYSYHGEVEKGLLKSLDQLVSPKLPKAGAKAKRRGRGAPPAAPVADVQQALTAKPKGEVSPGAIVVHVTPTGGKGDPVKAELQPDVRPGSATRKVIYVDSRTAAWVAVGRIVDLPDGEKAKAKPATGAQKAAKAELKTAVEAIKLIQAKPGITIPELAEAMGIQQNRLFRVLPGLADQIRKEGRGWYPLEVAA